MLQENCPNPECRGPKGREMTYQEILKLIDYPETVLVLDFETFFSTDYSMSKLSTIEFIQHRLFEFTGLGTSILIEGDARTEFTPELSMPHHQVSDTLHALQMQYGIHLKGCTVVVQNARFDITVLWEKFGIKPKYVIDLLDLLRHFDARGVAKPKKHDLASCAEYFGLKPKGDTKQFKGYRYADMDQAMREDLSDYNHVDLELTAGLFKKLLPKLSDPLVEIPLMEHTHKLYLEPQLEFDFTGAVRLTKAMREKMNNPITEFGYSKKQLSGSLSFVELLQAALPEGELVPVKYGKPGKNMKVLLNSDCMIPALAQDDDGCKALLIHPVAEVRNLMAARKLIKSWPLHIGRIKKMTDQAIASGGKMRVPLNYYGCHTGRWSGSDKINLLNLGGRGRTGSGIDPLISQVRGLLRAPEGFTLAIVDSAQIEARVLAWFAGQENLLDGFRRGEDVYSAYATKLFGEEVRKPIEDDPDELQELLKLRRGFGKDSILGDGFGLGAATSYLNCLKNTDLRPMFKPPVTTDFKALQKIMQGHIKALRRIGLANYIVPVAGEYDERFMAYMVLIYRDTYKKIPQFWGTVEGMFKFVTKYPHEVRSYGVPDAGICKQMLTMWNQKGTVYIQLPSGRTLTYRNARVDRHGSIQWRHGTLWGGSITENIVQAAARDLLCYWLMLWEQNGLPVVLHTYDELVAVVSEHRASDRLQIGMDLMCGAPDWATGLPLDAEGECSRVYKKS